MPFDRRLVLLLLLAGGAALVVVGRVLPRPSAPPAGSPRSSRSAPAPRRDSAGRERPGRRPCRRGSATSGRLPAARRQPHARCRAPSGRQRPAEPTWAPSTSPRGSPTASRCGCRCALRPAATGPGGASGAARDRAFQQRERGSARRARRHRPGAGAAHRRLPGGPRRLRARSTSSTRSAASGPGTAGVAAATAGAVTPGSRADELGTAAAPGWPPAWPRRRSPPRGRSGWRSSPSLARPWCSAAGG